MPIDLPDEEWATPVGASEAFITAQRMDSRLRRQAVEWHGYADEIRSSIKDGNIGKLQTFARLFVKYPYGAYVSDNFNPYFPVGDIMNPFILAAGYGHENLVPPQILEQCRRAANLRKARAKKSAGLATT
jgi:hypothetical protein